MEDMRAWTDEHRLETDLCAMCCEVVVIQNSVFTRTTIPMPEALYYFFLFIFILRIILRIVLQVYVEVSWKCAIACGNYRMKFLIQWWSANTMQTLCITIIFIFFSWKRVTSAVVHKRMSINVSKRCPLPGNVVKPSQINRSYWSASSCARAWPLITQSVNQ